MRNPHDIQQFLKDTDWLFVTDTQEYKLASQIHEAIRDAYLYCAEKPRWAAWWDQVNRSSLSIVANFSEGMGKGGGYFHNILMLARGEAYETLGLLSVGPSDICASIKPLALDLARILTERISALPKKPEQERTYWGRKY